MKRAFPFAILGVCLLVLAAALVAVTPVEATDTCPDGGDWVKVDGLSGKTYTYTAPAGKLVAEVCYKHSTFRHFYDVVPPASPVTVTADSHFVCPHWWNCEWKQYDLSHASFRLVAAPIPVAAIVDFIDPTCESQSAGVTYGNTDKVDYAITSGSLTPGATIVITATAKAGYVLTNGPTFTHQFPTIESLNCYEVCDETVETGPVESAHNTVWGDWSAWTDNGDGSYTRTRTGTESWTLTYTLVDAKDQTHVCDTRVVPMTLEVHDSQTVQGRQYVWTDVDCEGASAQVREIGPGGGEKNISDLYYHAWTLPGELEFVVLLDVRLDEPTECYDPPELCEDPLANNVGQPLPCTYDPPTCELTPLYYQFTLTNGDQTCYQVSWDRKDEIGKPNEFWIPNVTRQLCTCGFVAENAPYAGWVYKDCHGTYWYDGKPWSFFNKNLLTPHWEGQCAMGGC